MGSQESRKFSILDSRETSTLAFMVNESEGDTIYRTLQKLDCAMNEVESGIKRTFFINDISREGDIDIVLVTLGDGKARLNMAVLKSEKLFVSKDSTKIKYTTLYAEKQSNYDDIKYTPNFKRPISIIDPEIADEVRPTLYYDEETNMVRARVKLLPKKSYIALQVTEE
ncbi:MAG: hypothetical protein IJ220_06260 [Clostridia bacterium]|nr:hypothetical protein [Clostridia bacterium]